MNVALRFVESLGDAVAGAVGAGPMHAVMATPRFPSSRNVVFLLGPADSGRPTLVAKVARLAGRDDGLAREAGNLLALQRIWPGAACIPHLIAHGLFLGHQILLETAVQGRPMSPSVVRRQPDQCISAVVTWLIEHHDKVPVDAEVGALFPALVEEPLDELGTLLAPVPEAEALLARVRNEVQVLRAAGIPTVFEHGDLGSPNLILQDDGRAGVIDWELARPRGVPAADAFFFLTFVATSLARARTPQACAAAMHEAFFLPEAWARPHVLRYAAGIGLPADALPALFLLCWSRYLSHVPSRQAWAVAAHVDRTAARQITRDKHWHFWKHAVEHIDEFGCRA